MDHEEKEVKKIFEKDKKEISLIQSEDNWLLGIGKLLVSVKDDCKLIEKAFLDKSKGFPTTIGPQDTKTVAERLKKHNEFLQKINDALEEVVNNRGSLAKESVRKEHKFSAHIKQTVKDINGTLKLAEILHK